MHGRLEIVKYLAGEKGVDVNARRVGGNTFLHRAAIDGHLNIVKSLLDKGADINAKDNYNKSPLDKATENGRLKVIRYLVNNKKANINLTDLTHCASECSHLAVVRYFIDEKGVDASVKGKDGSTFLHSVAKSNRLEIVNKYSIEIAKYLIDEKRVNVNAQDNNGNTPLYFAYNHGNKDLIKLLLNKEANIDLQDNNGKTILHNALYPHIGCYYKTTECTKLLIAHKIKLQGSDAEKSEYQILIVQCSCSNSIEREESTIIYYIKHLLLTLPHLHYLAI